MTKETGTHKGTFPELRHKKALVVLSGGQDSTLCLFRALHCDFDEVHTITFDYGQRHVAELNAAERVAKLAGIPPERQEFVCLGNSILKSTSPLVSAAELEQYQDHQSLPGGIEKTFVPMRNQLFLTLAANRAIAIGATAIFTGVCQEDSGGYPDCRQEFINHLTKAINVGTFDELHDPRRIDIFTPLMNLTKAQSVHMAVSTPGAYHALAFSHTAYDGAYPPVGKDHATLLRAKGFEEADVPDPLIIRAWYEEKMELPKTPNYDMDKKSVAEFVQSVFDFLNIHSAKEKMVAK